ncbi:MAG: hypothetical protein ACJ8LV_00615 [Chthoniobacterales bacterium]
MAFRTDLRVSHAKKFGVKQMPPKIRSDAGMFSIYFNYGRKGICGLALQSNL